MRSHKITLLVLSFLLVFQAFSVISFNGSTVLAEEEGWDSAILGTETSEGEAYFDDDNQLHLEAKGGNISQDNGIQAYFNFMEIDGETDFELIARIVSYEPNTGTVNNHNWAGIAITPGLDPVGPVLALGTRNTATQVVDYSNIRAGYPQFGGGGDNATVDSVLLKLKRTITEAENKIELLFSEDEGTTWKSRTTKNASDGTDMLVVEKLNVGFIASRAKAVFSDIEFIVDGVTVYSSNAPEEGPLPTGWNAIDIGGRSNTTVAEFDRASKELTMEASGRQFNSTAGVEGLFSYMTVDGRSDFELTAQIISYEGSDPGSANNQWAGLLVNTGLEPGTDSLAFGYRGNDDHELRDYSNLRPEYPVFGGGGSAGVKAPVFIKIERTITDNSNDIAMTYSHDKENWSSRTSKNLSHNTQHLLADELYIGLVASRSAVTFKNIEFIVDGVVVYDSNVVEGAIPEEPPAKPADLMATQEGDDVSLSWKAVQYADTYEVQMSEDGINYSTSEDNLAVTKAIISGLNEGSYHFRVIAKNEFGDSAPSDAISITLKEPPVPAGLVATPLSGEAELQWNAVAAATSYTVKYNAVNGPVQEIENINDNKVTVTGLTNGTAYEFVVIAKNSFGESASSAKVSVIPGRPDGISTQPYNGAVKVHWNTVPGATGYEIRAGLNNAEAPYTISLKVMDGNAKSIVIPNLANNTEYKISVGAIFAEDAVVFSDDIVAVAVNAILPGQWQMQRIVNPALSNANHPKDIVLNYSGSQFEMEANQGKVQSGDDNVIFTYIPVDGSKDFTMKATVRSFGVEPAGNNSNDRRSMIMVKNGDKFNSPHISIGIRQHDNEFHKIFDYRRLNNTGEKREEGWAFNNTPVINLKLEKVGTDFKLYYKAEDDDEYKTHNTISSVVGGQDYMDSAVLNVGLAMSRSTVVFDEIELIVDGVVVFASETAPLTAPQDLQGTAMDESALLQWTKVAGATNYHIKVSETGGEPFDEVLVVGDVDEATVPGLVNGTEYSFVISAANAGGQGIHSSKVEVTPIAPPEKVQNVRSEAYNEMIALNWDSAERATSYVIRVGTSSGVYDDEYNTSGTSFAIPDLINDETYYITVSGVNSAGEGPQSDEIDAEPSADAGLDPLSITIDNPPPNTVANDHYTLRGKTNKYAYITVKVNDVKIVDHELVPADTLFEYDLEFAQGNNIITVTAVDLGDNQVEEVYQVSNLSIEVINFSGNQVTTLQPSQSIIATVEVSNALSTNQTYTLVIELVDGSNRVITYSYAYKTLLPGQNTVLYAGLRLPSNVGGLQARAYVVDEFNSETKLSNVVTIN